jgi:hypothetical protein
MLYDIPEETLHDILEALKDKARNQKKKVLTDVKENLNSVGEIKEQLFEVFNNKGYNHFMNIAGMLILQHADNKRIDNAVMMLFIKAFYKCKKNSTYILKYYRLIQKINKKNIPETKTPIKISLPKSFIMPNDKPKEPGIIENELIIPKIPERVSKVNYHKIVKDDSQFIMNAF